MFGLTAFMVFTINIFFITSLKTQQNINRPIAQGALRPTKILFTKEWEWPIGNIKDIRQNISLYDTIVPVIGRRNTTKDFILKRSELFQIGFYPGVEYRILNISDSLIKYDDDMATVFSDEFSNTISSSTSATRTNRVLTVRPAYKLIPQLERDWPVNIPISLAPLIVTKGMYNTLTVITSFSIAFSLFMASFLLSNLFTLSVVNSKSMIPTILPKDVILVEKITPAFKRLFHIPITRKNDVIFFSAPSNFNQYIDRNNNNLKLSNQKASDSTASSSSNSGIKISASISNSGDVLKKEKPSYANDKFYYLKPVVDKSTLLVKRVNDINPTRLMTTDSRSDNNLLEEIKLDDNIICIDVRGDNPPVSLDSRQWGCLSPDNIVGTPVLRILPLSRFGVL